MCPPKDVAVLTSIPVDVTLFGNRVFADDQVKMRSLGWALIQYDCVLVKRGDLNTDTDMHRGKTCEDTGGRWHRSVRELDLEQILPQPHKERPSRRHLDLRLPASTVQG